jgi:hypothetical protein
VAGNAWVKGGGVWGGACIQTVCTLEEWKATGSYRTGISGHHEAPDIPVPAIPGLLALEVLAFFLEVHKCIGPSDRHLSQEC